MPSLERTRDPTGCRCRGPDTAFLGTYPLIAGVLLTPNRWGSVGHAHERVDCWLPSMLSSARTRKSGYPRRQTTRARKSVAPIGGFRRLTTDDPPLARASCKRTAAPLSVLVQPIVKREYFLRAATDIAPAHGRPGSGLPCGPSGDSRRTAASGPSPSATASLERACRPWRWRTGSPPLGRK